MKRLLLVMLFSIIAFSVSNVFASASPKTYLYSTDNRPILMNFYISILGGLNSLQTDSLTFEQNVDSAGYTKQPFHFYSDHGYRGAIAPGFQYEYFRIEEELGYLDNKVDKITQNNVDYNLKSGDVKAFVAITNLYFDFNFKRLLIIPYVGVGAGFAHLQFNFDRKTNTANNPLSGNTNNFAYQAIVGLKYFMTKNFSIHLDYRYLDTANNSRFEKKESFGGQNVVDRIKPNYTTESFNLGLTYHFPEL